MPDEIEDELNALVAQQQATAKRIAELGDLRREKMRLEAEERNRQKPVNVRVVNATVNSFTIKGDFREDVVAFYKSFGQSRLYDGYGNNTFRLADYARVIAGLRAMPGVTVVEGEYKRAIDELVSGPDYSIKAESKVIAITVGFNRDNLPVSRLPGVHLSTTRNVWELSLSEAWRLPEVFADLEKKGKKVEWAPKLKEECLRQLASRATLDKIALEKDADINVDLQNGNELRPFQRVGIKFADVAGGRCIIADQMGLGKTWQYIGLCEYRGWCPNVIICPASLKNNWVREIRKLTGCAAYVLSGSMPSDYDVIRLLTEKPKYIVINYDILAYSVEHTKSHVDSEGVKHESHEVSWPWVATLQMLQPASICCDESHYIKNPEAKRTRAALQLLKVPHIIHMTGTPVLNRPGELWPMLHMLDPVKFPIYERFLVQYTKDGKFARNVEELRSMLSPLMIRRLKKDVMAELPPINRIYEYHTLSDRARTAYNEVLDGLYRRMENWGDKETPASEVTNVLTELLRCKQVASLDKADFTCDLADEAYQSSEGDDYRKVIVFSQFVESVSLIAETLTRSHGPEAVVHFTGQTPQIERTLLQDAFQNKEEVKFLVTTMRVAGEGLTLTQGGHVIFNDLGWTPAIHEQAEGRAYGRLNAAHGINSYFVIAENTIETWIQELLAAKLSTIQAVVEGYDEDRQTGFAMNIIQRLREEMWLTRK